MNYRLVALLASIITLSTQSMDGSNTTHLLQDQVEWMLSTIAQTKQRAETSSHPDKKMLVSNLTKMSTLMTTLSQENLMTACLYWNNDRLEERIADIQAAMRTKRSLVEIEEAKHPRNITHNFNTHW